MEDRSFSLNCDFKTIEVNGKKVQTYSIGYGPNVIFSFPAFPHSGLIYILFMLKYDLSKVRLITFDLPGWIGMTEKFDKSGEFDSEVIEKIVDGIVKEYKMVKFNVIGYSFGSLLALMAANRYSDRVEKVALVSPIVRSNLAVKSNDALKMKLLKYTKTYFLMKPYVTYRFNKYYDSLLREGIPAQFLTAYKDMMKGAENKYLFESIYHLFFNDSGDLLKGIADKKILVVNSKTETPYFRKQSGYIRQVLKGEKSLYMEGEHEDFLLHPQKEVVTKIVRFLTT